MLAPLAEAISLERHEVRLRPDATYRTAGIYSFGKGLFERTEIRGSDTSYSSLFELREDQFVISRLNGWEGAIDVVPAELAGCLVSAEYPTFRVLTERADPEYLRWVARWPALWDKLRPRGSMVRRKRVQTSQLLDLNIPLPHIDEQRRIAAHLNRVASLVREIDGLGRRAGVLAESWKVATTGMPRLGDSERAALGWRLVRLGDVMTLDRDPVPVDAAGVYPNVGVFSFGRGLFAKPPINGASTSATTLYRIHAGQFIYSRLFAFEGAYTDVTDQFDGCFVSQEFPTFSPDGEHLDARWLASFLRSKDRWAELSLSSRGLGVRRQRVQPEAILHYQVWLPPIEDQQKTVNQLAKMNAVVERQSSRAGLVKSLVQSEMDQALGG